MLTPDYYHEQDYTMDVDDRIMHAQRINMILAAIAIVNGIIAITTVVVWN